METKLIKFIVRIFTSNTHYDIDCYIKKNRFKYTNLIEYVKNKLVDKKVNMVKVKQTNHHIEYIPYNSIIKWSIYYYNEIIPN